MVRISFYRVKAPFPPAEARNKETPHPYFGKNKGDGDCSAQKEKHGIIPLGEEWLRAS